MQDEETVLQENFFRILRQYKNRANLSSTFQQDDFGIRPILAIFAHNDISLTTGDTVAAAIRLLHLRAPIVGLVVEELDTPVLSKLIALDGEFVQYADELGV